MEYDGNGNLIKETNQLGESRSYAYTPLGDVESITDEAGGLPVTGIKKADYWKKSDTQMGQRKPLPMMPTEIWKPIPLPPGLCCVMDMTAWTYRRDHGK